MSTRKPFMSGADWNLDRVRVGGVGGLDVDIPLCLGQYGLISSEPISANLVGLPFKCW